MLGMEYINIKCMNLPIGKYQAHFVPTLHSGHLNYQL